MFVRLTRLFLFAAVWSPALVPLWLIARFGDPRPDLVGTLGDWVLYSGWKRVLASGEALRAGNGLSAWAYDLATNTSCQLEGRMGVKR